MIVCIGGSGSGLVRREHRLGAEDAAKGPLKMLQSRIPIYVRAIIFWVLFVVIVALFWIQVGLRVPRSRQCLALHSVSAG